MPSSCSESCFSRLSFGGPPLSPSSDLPLIADKLLQSEREILQVVASTPSDQDKEGTLSDGASALRDIRVLSISERWGVPAWQVDMSLQHLGGLMFKKRPEESEENLESAQRIGDVVLLQRLEASFAGIEWSSYPSSSQQVKEAAFEIVVGGVGLDLIRPSLPRKLQSISFPCLVLLHWLGSEKLVAWAGKRAMEEAETEKDLLRIIEGYIVARFVAVVVRYNLATRLAFRLFFEQLTIRDALVVLDQMDILTKSALSASAAQTKEMSSLAGQLASSLLFGRLDVLKRRAGLSEDVVSFLRKISMRSLGELLMLLDLSPCIDDGDVLRALEELQGGSPLRSLLDLRRIWTLAEDTVLQLRKSFRSESTRRRTSSVSTFA